MTKNLSLYQENTLNIIIFPFLTHKRLIQKEKPNRLFPIVTLQPKVKLKNHPHYLFA